MCTRPHWPFSNWISHCNSVPTVVRTVTVRDVAFAFPLFCSFVTQRRRTPGCKKTASPILPTPATCRARRWL